jgi:hypothetical protein
MLAAASIWQKNAPEGATIGRTPYMHSNMPRPKTERPDAAATFVSGSVND